MLGFMGYPAAPWRYGILSAGDAPGRRLRERSILLYVLAPDVDDCCEIVLNKYDDCS